MSMDGKDKKLEGLVREIRQAPSHTIPNAPVNPGGQLPRPNVLDIIIENQSTIKTEIISELSSAKNALEEKMNVVINLLSTNNHGIEHTHFVLLKFIQDLNVWLDDSRIDADFAKFVQEEIKGVLSIYGYKFVDYEPPYENCYEVQIEPKLEEEEIQVIRRAIYDERNNNLIIQGAIWKKQS